MAELTEADKYLLDRIGQGDGDAWAQLVDRYHGRLRAFALGRLGPGRGADADDLVQETFAAFLQSFRSFRRDASLETYLFTILRRRLIDLFRGRGTGGLRPCSINDLTGPAGGGSSRNRDDSAAGGGNPQLPGHEPAASWYARRDEQAERLSAALGEAFYALVARLKDAQNLRDLRIVEMLFYAQLRNKDVARLAGLDEKQVALLKHRWLKEVRARVSATLGADPPDDTHFNADALDPADSLLTRAWERRRPTCPKRSTLGQYLLGTLEPEWRQYVDFHARQLGCRFCQANLDDLQRQEAREPRALRERIFQSTVGFLSQA